MPYIPQVQRNALDAKVEALAEAIVEESKKDGHDAAFAGLLNYSMTTLVLQVIKKRFGKMRYWMLATVTGVFKNASDEFYRRAGAAYEDKKIAEDGDVKGYKDILA